MQCRTVLIELYLFTCEIIQVLHFPMYYSSQGWHFGPFAPDDLSVIMASSLFITGFSKVAQWKKNYIWDVPG